MAVVMAATIAVVGYTAYQKGYSKAMIEASVTQALALEEAVKSYDALIGRKDATVAALTAKAKQRQVEYREITKEVVKYVETTPDIQCFDDSGLQLISKIAHGRSSSAENTGTSSSEVSRDAP